MTTCSFTTCSADATVTLRMIPRRTDTPISQVIARAMVWPGVESATTIHSCALHRAAFRQAARTVMIEVALDGNVDFRVMKDE